MTNEDKIIDLERYFSKVADDQLRAGHGVMAVVGAMVAAAMTLLRRHVGESAPAKLLRGIADNLEAQPTRKAN